jgi:hypothetical protein
MYTGSLQEEQKYAGIEPRQLDLRDPVPAARRSEPRRTRTSETEPDSRATCAGESCRIPEH